MQRKNRKLTEKILELYPSGECALEFSDAFELLVASRLSAQCTDVRVNIVTSEMFKKLKTPEDYAEADITEIENYIRSCGLYHTKARDIKAMSQMIIDDFGGNIPDNMDDLLRLPGVGRKIANLIVGEVFGAKGAIVADTHCIRLSNRLGYCDSTNPAVVERELRAVIPPAKSMLFCHALVSHGRKVCKAQRPDCENCALKGDCVYARKKEKSAK